MINELCKQAHATQVEKGFVEEGKPRNFAECIALVHSELSEALEGNREGCQEPDFGTRFQIEEEISSIKSTKEEILTYNKFKKSPGFELADAIIRILGMVEEHGIEDFEWYITTKMAYNQKRPYKHGKNY
jgi:hypothetical protein